MPAFARAILACSLALAAGVRTGPPCEVRYRLVDRGAENDRDWHVTLEAQGLAGARGPVRVELQDWGEWTEVDAYYLRDLASDPPLRRLEGSRNQWEVDAPPGWDGRLRVDYALATTVLGSKAMEAHGLLPWRAPTYAFGFSANTLMSVTAEGLEPVRRLRIEVPQDWTVATGAGGLSTGAQECELPERYGNGVISFGRPVAIARRDGDWTPIEVIQWAGPPGVAEGLADFARDYVAACSESLDLPPTGTLRLIVDEPGMGGTRTDGSIAVGCPSSIDGRTNPYTAHFLAHEIFHDWLGGLARGPGESMAWFWEGFTEYLSLLHLAKAGLIERSWFAARLGDHREDMAKNAHWGDTAYADTGVNWRDPAIEPLAYGGSALLAFALDVRLRRAGGEGLVELVRDLCALPDGRYDLAILQRWLEDHGQADFWSGFVAGTRRPDVDEDLDFAGFVRREVEVPLTYLGLRIEPEGGFGKIVAIDPDGPAAGSGLELGDEVSGRAPFREASVRVAADVETPYRYGLELYDPRAERCEVHVHRNGEERMFTVVPRLVPGGLERKLEDEPERQERFFGSPSPTGR